MCAKTTIGVLDGRPFDVLLQPLELLGAEIAEAAGLEIHDVHEPDEVHALVVEAEPALASCVLAVALQVLPAVVGEHVVLARDVEDLAHLGPDQHLLKRVEFLGLREVREVARVDQEIRRDGQRLNPADGRLQGRDDVLVGVLRKPDVAVADLREDEVSGGEPTAAREAEERQRRRLEHARRGHPGHASARPRHAVQKAASVDAVLVAIDRVFVFVFVNDRVFHDDAMTPCVMRRPVGFVPSPAPDALERASIPAFSRGNKITAWSVWMNTTCRR